MSSIFIQIASYRDPELIPTLNQMISHAAYPENLYFGICRQYHPNEKFDNLDHFKEDERFRILEVPYNESKGVCWARNQIQSLYSNETYTLQIDSHMRFIHNWDIELISMIEGLQKAGVRKPLLTAYAPSYDPENDPESRVMEPWRMAFDRFIPEGAIFFLPEVIPNWKNLNTPVPSRFYSAHFCFTLGDFVKEVPHDPEYYFHGEEISIAVRAYTHGYDLFHPHKVVLWHEYTRKGRTKQWDDDKQWYLKNEQSHALNRRLFGMDGEEKDNSRGLYGFGKARNLRDYEMYSGILFEKRCVQQYTLDKKYPPNPGINHYGSENEWLDSFLSVFNYCINIHKDLLPENDYEFFAVAFHSDNDHTMYRKDADRNEIINILMDEEDFCKIWRSFQTDKLPSYWVVWPYSKAKGWCDRLEGKV